MKISKLFHWLYAILMLLPFAFFVPSVLYYAFNDNATMQSVELPKTETISVDFNQNIDYTIYNNSNQSGIYVTTNDYALTFNGQLSTSYVYIQINKNNTFSLNNAHKYYIKGVNEFRTITGGGTNCLHIPSSGNLTVVNQDGIYTPINNTSNALAYWYVTSQMEFTNQDFYLEIFDLTKMYGLGNEPTKEIFDSVFTNGYYPYTESELMQITYDTGETEQLVENTSIINYAWESIWDLPLFSWCKVSFVATPFTYITGLFGLAASNSFNYVFTYFASMSIIWLVFDVIMYVPLLVHRWLDKGIVE